MQDFSDYEYVPPRIELLILRFLVDGPLPFKVIKDHLESITERDPNEPQNIRTYKLSSDHGYYKVLRRMRQKGTIISRRYSSPNPKKKMVFSLYGITPKGLSEVRRVAKGIDYCRMDFPTRETVSHDLQVVLVIKSIRREMMRHKLPHFIEDENDIKKKTKGPKKNKAYPDLHVKVVLFAGTEEKHKELAIELDNDTIDKKRVVDKAIQLYKERRWPTVVLCNTRKRMDELKDELGRRVNLMVSGANRRGTSEGELTEIMKTVDRFVIVNTSEFITKGLLSASMEKADGTKAYMVRQQ